MAFTSFELATGAYLMYICACSQFSPSLMLIPTRPSTNYVLLVEIIEIKCYFEVLIR